MGREIPPNCPLPRGDPAPSNSRFIGTIRVHDPDSISDPMQYKPDEITRATADAAAAEESVGYIESMYVCPGVSDACDPSRVVSATEATLTRATNTRDVGLGHDATVRIVRFSYDCLTRSHEQSN